MFDFTDKVVIVTGGNKGIGENFAMNFAAAGAKVAVWGRTHADNEKVAAQIVANGGIAVPMRIDVSKQDQVEAGVAAVLDAFGGRIDILINNAGIMSKVVDENYPAESPEEWRKVIDVDLTGSYICAWAVMPVMRKQGFGRIINIASIAGKKIAVARAVSYSSAKAGVIGLTRHLAMEGGAFGITANAICPGGTLTDMLRSITTPEGLADRETKIPTGRLATPQDMSNLAMFLASDLAEQITGQAIDVDGGQLIYWVDRDTYFKGLAD